MSTIVRVAPAGSHPTVTNAGDRLRFGRLLDLVGLNEAARMAGVSRQRMFILSQRPDFPKPVAKVDTGRLWTRQIIKLWLKSWDRKPGRPAIQKTRRSKRG